VTRRLVLLACLLGAAVLGGCRAELGVTVQADSGGAGTLTFEVNFDAVMRRAVTEAGFPDVFSANAPGQYRDLRAAGWEVRPAAAGTGVAFSHGFDRPEDLSILARQLAGDDPDVTPFVNLELSADRGFWKTRLRFRGRIDLAPERIVDVLVAGVPNAPTQAEIETIAARPLAELVVLRFAYVTPGAVSEVGWSPKRLRPRGLTWTLRPGDRVDVTVRSEVWNPAAVVLGVAVLTAGFLGLVAAGLGVRQALRQHKHDVVEAGDARRPPHPAPTRTKAPQPAPPVHQEPAVVVSPEGHVRVIDDDTSQA
jgi:hypothetical protein